MRYLTKLHLVNWHYIQYRTIELAKDINFITGETGAGKSTILDALQLIILGDLKGHYFNKAANENSQRKLIEYLRGMIQDSNDEGKKCLRDDMDFNSYIVIEVLNTVTKEVFCLGVVFEVRKNINDYEHMFFRLKGTLPETGFIKDNTPLSIKNLKEEYGSLLKPHSTEEYNEHFLHEYMGKLKNSFFDVFKKSVAFKPPASIEQFIQEFICDDIKIDVEAMVTPIRIYKKIEKEAEGVEGQIKSLQVISEEYEKLEDIREQYKISKFIYDKSELELENIKYIKLQQEISDAKQFIEIESNRMEESEIKVKGLVEEIATLRDQIQNSQEIVLYKEIEELTIKITEFKSIQNSFKADAIRFERWVNCLQYLNLMNDNLSIDLEYYVKEIYQMKLYNINEESFLELNRNLSDLAQIIKDQYANVATQLSKHNEDRETIKEELDRLVKGIVYPPSTGNLKDILESRLSEIYGIKTKVEIVADLIEVKDKEWIDALEGYMNWQKFYLIIEPQYYQKAINIYKRLDKRQFYDAGIVDVEKIAKDKYAVVRNSLAEEIVTDNEYVRVYINYLLGRVIKCNDFNDIREHKTAITKDCFLYKGYIARRLHPDLYLKNRCIGAESRKLRIQGLTINLTNLELQIVELDEVKKKLGGFINLKFYSKEEVTVRLIEQEKINEITILESKKQEKEIELSKVDLFYVERLRETHEQRISEKDDLEQLVKKLNNEIIKKEYVIEVGIQKVIDQQEEQQCLERRLYENFDKNWMENSGEKCFKDVVDRFRNYNAILTTYKEKYEDLDKNRTTQFQNVTKRRREYCIKNSLTWDTHAEDNEKYSEQLNLLVETKLPQYIEKINIQKEKAYTAFKTDLLSRLKDAIDKTEEQVTFINRSLEKMRFGEKRYKFIVRPKGKYIDFYNMLKNEFLGMDLTASLFEEQYKDQIEFLFNLIVNTTENITGSDMEQLRKQIDIYTDYKTYLEFDMEQIIGTDKSDLSKILRKNSGGETQSPFFIAVLAAFANHYRIYNSKDNNTMRLIIFDEAFSKMDEEHAMISIELLRKLGFQAIIAAPDDKIPVIGPCVDKIFYVKNENKRRIAIAEFEDKEIGKLINGGL